MTKLQELINKLNQLFELDKTDLDFGVYRLINQRQDKIKDFITNKLPVRVDNILGSANTQDLEDAYNKAKEECIASFGKDAFNSEEVLSEALVKYPIGKKFIEAKDKFQNKSLSSQLETEVYSHLLDFFSRYYQDGDFISQRRSAIKDKYAIPYNGEEVVMHWANKDQYYIKSSETLKDYVFTLGTLTSLSADNKADELPAFPLRIKFKLAGSDAVKDNNQAKRQMLLFKEFEGAYDETNGRVNIQVNDKELVIPFYFKEVSKAFTEKQHLEYLESNINELLKKDWKELLSQRDETYTGKDSRSILGKHLQAYVRKQTSDFFIHKDLGGFLKRELDFYIKNEVMYLDDVVDKEPDYLTSEIRKIKAIRTIAQELIDFLAQIENFQKKLWLKKKFIYQTNYCITLDRIPQDFYPEIAENQKQIQEWKKLFAIEETKTDAIYTGFDDFEKGNAQTKLKFLTDNKYLVLDTAFFSQDFKYKLLSTIDNLDEKTDGLLIHSENFQALNLLQERYKEKVKCIYIDPPYNAKSSEILYKNTYKHSSFNSLIFDRVNLSKKFLYDEGIFSMSIDDYEAHRVKQLINDIFDESSNIGSCTIVHNPGGRDDDKYIATTHEYLYFYVKNLDKARLNLLKLTEEQLKEYKYEDTISKYKLQSFVRTGSNSRPEDRPNLYYSIYYSSIHDKLSLNKTDDSYFEVKPKDSANKDRVWRWSKERFNEKKQTEFVVTKHKNKFIIKAKKRYTNDNDSGSKPKSVWSLSKYSSSTQGTILLNNLFQVSSKFSYPKSLYIIYDAVYLSTDENSLVLDYFAGSGTTGHAVINLNREDNGKRKYILVEMGSYFDTVTKPRIEKVVYSKDWRGGKPLTRDTGVSHCFKYIRMESYEDTLNNLTLQDKTPDLFGIESESVNQDYLINYMLDIESKASLMDIDKFDSPFDYQIKIHNYESGQAELKQVDLIETFNYLLGIEVLEFKLKDGFVKIEGINPANERILIIWRNVGQQDNKALNDFLANERINPAETEYRAIYVNGDHTIEDPHKKINNIAEVFNELMFECEDV